MNELTVRPVHSPIGASSMYRWAECPGSVKLSDGIASISSPYAEEGTTAHEYGALWLQGSGKQPPLPEGVDDEMAEFVKVYVDHVFGLMDPGDRLFVEHGFDLSQIYPGAYGTNDASVYKKRKKTLHVIDLKYGSGIWVDVKDNPQLRYYGLGALIELMTLGETVDTVVLTIVQPRCASTDGPIRSETIEAVELLEFAADLKMYAERTTQPNAPLKAGDHCRFCPALQICPEVNKTRQEVAKLEFAPALPYDPAKLKLALDSIPVMKAWIKRVDEFAYAEAEAGRCPPGYKLVEKRATRKWRSEDEVALYLGGLKVSDDLIFEPRAIRSVAQMEQALPDHKELLKKFVTKESSGHTLVDATDKRPAVKLSAKEEFKVIDLDPLA
jgi:hypothetical protein